MLFRSVNAIELDSSCTSSKLRLHETVVMKLSEMPNLKVKEEFITSNVRYPSSQVSVEIRCRGITLDSTRIIGRINPIPLSDVEDHLDCWVALHGGEVDSLFPAPGMPVPQVSFAITCFDSIFY